MQHGVFIDSIISSEITAAAQGNFEKVLHDPFAMLPFCGYNMADYFSHWLHIGKLADKEKLPKIFHVNWFRKSKDGKFLWPGFGDNIRVIKWIFEQCDNTPNRKESPIGFIPNDDAIDVSNLEVENIRQYYQIFGNDLPAELIDELNALDRRLSYY